MSEQDDGETDRADLEARVIDPEKAPNKFVRLMDGTEELAVIPWADAKKIAEAVNEYNER